MEKSIAFNLIKGDICGSLKSVLRQVVMPFNMGEKNAYDKKTVS